MSRSLCSPEIVNVICTRVAELLVHIGDSGSGGLAHHCGGAKAERRSDVEVEVITVMVPQEMIVKCQMSKMSNYCFYSGHVLSYTKLVHRQA